MTITPNRMQRHWAEVRAFLEKEWPALTPLDLEEIDGQYDRLITKVRDLYDGLSEITQEAAIKGKVQRFLNQIESL